MPVNIKELFKTHGVNIELNGAKGMGLPITEETLANNPAAELSEVSGGHAVVAGDMLTATVALDDNGNPKLNDNGRPKRVGGYIKLGVDNQLSLMIPRAEEGAAPYALDASNTRRAAAQLIRMERDAKFEVAKIAEDHEEAMVAYNNAVEDGERVEEPVARTPRHDPAVFARFEGFISAAQAVIAAEVGGAFASVEERKNELMASFEIRNEQRKTLSPEQMSKAAEARSLKEQIAAMNPDHPMALRSIAGTYTGNGEAAEKAVEALRDGPIGVRFNKGIPKMGPAADLIDPLVASFTTEKPENVYMAALSGSQRRRFEQEMGRYANPEIGTVLKGQIDGVMNDRMAHYSCDAQFFTHKGVDMLMVSDVESQRSGTVFLYVMDAEARSVDLDIEALNRPATEEDVPTDEQLVALRAAVTEMTFDNGEDIDFIDDEELEDDEEPDFF